MNAIYHNTIEQCTLPWFEKRLGKMTGSKLDTIIDSKTGKLKSDTNKDDSLKTKTPILNAIAGIIAEIETGFSNDSDYTSEAMEWGNDNEPVRIEQIQQDESFITGFVTNDMFKYFGVSPDLLEGDQNAATKGTEIKCPNSKTFALWVIKNELPAQHIVQVMSYFVAMPTVESVDFDMFDPRYSGKQSHTITVKRSDNLELIANIQQSLIEFDAMIDKYIQLFK